MNLRSTPHVGAHGAAHSARKGWAITLIVVGALLTVFSPVPVIVGYVQAAVQAFAMDFNEFTALENRDVFITDPPETMTLFAKLDAQLRAEDCTVSSPTGAAVPVEGERLPDVSHTQGGVHYEPFAVFEADESGSYRIDCAGNTMVFAQAGLHNTVSIAWATLIATVVMAVLGLVGVVVGIVWLVKARRRSRIAEVIGHPLM